MCPSTDFPASQARFAKDVLDELLRRITEENDRRTRDSAGADTVYRVSHAWTDGAFMFVVYAMPPDERIWGLVRDTRRSLIDEGPWFAADNPALNYFLLDFEEGWPAPPSMNPDDSETIHWRGDPYEGLPDHTSDIPDAHRAVAASTPPRRGQAETHPVLEARRYADPNGPLPRRVVE